MDTEAIEGYYGLDTESHAANPFIGEAYFNAVRVASSKALFDGEDFKGVGGEIVPVDDNAVSQINYKRSYLVDVEPSCKVYQKQSKHLASLDGASLQLLWCIVCSVSRGTDRVKINVEKYMEVMGIKSNRTFYSALKTLVNSFVLAKHKPHIYWINPHLIFNGKRLEKYKDKVKVIAHNG